MLVKSETEAEAKAQARWDVAMVYARKEFESSWKCHLREKEASLSEDRVLDLAVMFAMCIWLEKLGPNLVANNGSIEWYQEVTQEDMTHMSHKPFASKMQQALQESHDELKELMKVVDFNTFKVVQDHDEICDDLHFKLKLWKEISGPKTAASALDWLTRWKEQWQLEYWSTDYASRKKLLSELRKASKVIRVAAHGIYYSPELAEQRIEKIAKSFFSECLTAEPAYPRKRKERDSETGNEELAEFKQSGCWDAQALRAYRRRFMKGARCFYYALEGIQSCDQNKVGLLEVEEMQDDIDVAVRALHKAASNLRLKLHADREQENRETARLQAENEALKATVAADRKKFEEEKAQLAASRLKFNKERAQVKEAARAEAVACQKCLQRPHNVVIIPCLHAKYCMECLQTHRKTSATCPICAEAITGTFQYKV